MQLPIVSPAPLAPMPVETFADLCENQCQLRHFPNYLTGLLVLPNKSLANSARCIRDRADKTHLSRFFSAAHGFQEQVNARRLRYLLAQTPAVHRPAAESARMLDATLCEHGGSLLAYVDRHYNHGADTYPLAHNAGARHFVSGPVRFPVALRPYRRYAELAPWATFVQKHFPERPIPTQRTERTARHKHVDAQLVTDPAFLTRQQQFRTKIDWPLARLDTAVERKWPFRLLRFAGWYLTEALGAAARRHQKDWSSLLKKNRNRRSASFMRKEAQGQPIARPGPHSAVQKLIPRLPASA